ncbi:MAG: hypothetical protein ACFFG0_28345 [Candidatus Thorarchaeota archaeon]
MSDEKNSIIIAPHPDDEIIGCFEILNKQNQSITIIYGADTYGKRREETVKVREVFPSVKHQVFHNSVPTSYLANDATFYFPDPVNEIHPSHRGWGSIGEGLARSGYDVVFYTTIMNVPYIHEVNDPIKKETLLSRCYTSQKTLWDYEKKYVLFEGRCKWIF